MKALVLMLLAVALAAPVRAQSAVDRYHDAARLYIDGQREPAETVAREGLALDPDDARLQALLDLIREEQPPQNGDQGESAEEQEERGEDPAQDGAPGQDDGQGRQDRMPPPDDEVASDGPPQNPQEGQGAQTPEKQEPGQAGRPDQGATPQDAPPVEPGRMSRAEAQRILNAVGAGEEQLLQRMQRQQARPRRVTRDW